MTKELIKMNTDNKGVLTVSARLLYEKLEVKTEFNHWIERMIDYGFEEKNGLLVFFGEKYRRSSIERVRLDYRYGKRNLYDSAFRNREEV